MNANRNCDNEIILAPLSNVHVPVHVKSQFPIRYSSRGGGGGGGGLLMV